MPFVIKARILLHFARKNRLVAAINLGQLVILLLGGLYFGAGGVSGMLIFATKHDLGTAALATVALALGAFCLLGVAILPSQWRTALNRLLTPSSDQHGYVLPLEAFEASLAQRPLMLAKGH